jgi:hypothetical protein
VLRCMIRHQARFCGVAVFTHSVLANHFHIVVRVPQVVELSDAELVVI